MTQASVRPGRDSAIAEVAPAGWFALVLPEPTNRLFSNDQFFPGIIHGVSDELEAAGRSLVVAVGTSASSRAQIERYAAGGHLGGVIVASMHGADPLPERLARTGVPVITCGRPLGDRAGSVPYVDVDHAHGVTTAVRYLVRCGRQRIATIAGPQDMVAGIERLAGYRRELAGSGRRSSVAVGDFTLESGAAAMRDLLADDPRLDAVFVASDLMAEGALRTLRREGRSVPDDVAVIGFDDVDAARCAEPALTTVRQPIEDIGRRLARQLLRLSAGEPVEPALVLSTRLILRQSA
jgi:DNA-binding LacI/PurR family transcriptional regulator